MFGCWVIWRVSKLWIIWWRRLMLSRLFVSFFWIFLIWCDKSFFSFFCPFDKYFVTGFLSFDWVCFRGIEPEEDVPGISIISSTGFSADLANVLVEARNISSSSSSSSRGEWLNREKEIDSSDPESVRSTSFFFFSLSCFLLSWIRGNAFLESEFYCLFLKVFIFAWSGVKVFLLSKSRR